MFSSDLQVALSTRRFLQNHLCFFRKNPSPLHHIRSAWIPYFKSHQKTIQYIKEKLRMQYVIGSCFPSNKSTIPPLELSKWCLNVSSSIIDQGVRNHMWSKGINRFGYSNIAIHPVSAITIWKMFEQLMNYQNLSWEICKTWFENPTQTLPNSLMRTQEQRIFAWNIKIYENKLEYVKFVQLIHRLLDSKEDSFKPYFANLFDQKHDSELVLRTWADGNVFMCLKPGKGVETDPHTRYWNNQIFGNSSILLFKMEDIEVMQPKLEVCREWVIQDRKKTMLDMEKIDKFLEQQQDSFY